MTNASQFRTASIAIFARYLISLEIDYIALIDDIRSYRPIDPECDDLREMIESLTILEMRDLCDMLEICPMHSCDINICADDEIAECAHLR
jgi:hypothetical protein